jgi:hypothetical protein
VLAVFDASQLQTYSGTLLPSGTTPPAITLTGAQTVFMPLGLRVECTTLGALATSRIRYSYDSGANWAHSVVPTAATIALDGIAAGLVLNIAAGTMATNNVWELVVSAAASLRNSADVLAASGFACPRLLTGTSGIDGQPAWAADGLDKDPGAPAVYQHFVNSTLATPAVNGTTGVSLFAIMSAGASPTSGFNSVMGLGTGTTPGVNLEYAGGGITSVSSGGGIIVTTGYTAGTPKVLVTKQVGVAGDFCQWGAARTTDTAGGMTARTGMAMFCRGDIAEFSPAKIAVLVIVDGDIEVGDLLTKIKAYYAPRFPSWSALNS